ncbi:MAG: universal stress protein [Pirellulales bacterium]|nr:universal stress protein [Pirellulales bacterium]
MKWLHCDIVVVPIDFSDDSFAALETAAEMVDDPAHLHVVHVLPILEPTDPGIIWATIDDESRSQHAREAMQARLEERGHQIAQLVVRFGDPGHEIAQYAEEVEAGLVVVSSHGQSAIRHLLIGSVAERVVRLAHCPVLVLKK